MAGNYTQLLDIINNPTQHGLPAWDNNAKQIEGETVQQYLLTIIQSLTAGFQFMGVATPSTNPGTPDQNVFYIGGAGSYSNFGTSITVRQGQICIFAWNGSWTNTPIEIANMGFANVNYLRNAPSTPYNNAASAFSDVYNSLRHKGLIVSYLLSDGWHISQFFGDVSNDWNNPSYWLELPNSDYKGLIKTPSLVVVQGARTSANLLVSSSKRITTGLFKINSTITLSANTGYKILLYVFNESGTIISNNDWENSHTLTAAQKYYAFNIKKIDESDITPSEFANAISTDLSGCEAFISGDIVEFQISQLNIDNFKGNVTQTLSVFNAGRSGDTGLISYSNKRILTGLFKANSSLTISANSGYEFGVFVHNKNFETVQKPSFPQDWKTSYSITNTERLYMLMIRKSDNSDITPAEFSDAISTDLSGCVFYAYEPLTQFVLNDVQKKIDELSATDDSDRFNINEHLIGLTDMVWENQNWVFPQVITYNGVRNCLYFTFTNQAGYSGIACYNFDTQQITKTYLKHNYTVDDHNLIAVLMMSNKKLLCATSVGHTIDKRMVVRIAKAQESIEMFEDAQLLTCSENTDYAQLFEYDGKIYMFYRLGDKKWGYRISDDFGETWSGEYIFITSSVQYYIQLTETTTDGVLRLCCYSNPDAGDSAIRMGFLHLDTMTLYDNTNTNVIGTTDIDKNDIPIVIPITTGKVNRLFNAAKTAIADTKILYCVFTYPSQIPDGEYFVYNNGVSTKIQDAGLAMWAPKGQLGCAWIGTTQIAVARCISLTTDVLEIYDFDASTNVVELNRQVASHAIAGDYRTGRPMVDNNQVALLYLQGYFNPNLYTDFEMDGKIEFLQEA